MGKLVAFWSPFVGKAKVTSSICVVAGVMAMEHPQMDIAICSTGTERPELEEKLDADYGLADRREVYKRTGLTALKTYCRQSRLTPEKIRRSAIPLKGNTLYLYPHVAQMEAEELTFCLITEALKNESDVLFLDVENGMRENSMRYLKKADLVVVVLPQDPVAWKQFIQMEQEAMEGVTYCVLLGGYLDKSRFNCTFFSRNKEVRIQGSFAGVIPMNTGLFDAMQEGRTLDYLYKNQKCRKKEGNYGFVVQTKQAAEFIKKALQLSDAEK